MVIATGGNFPEVPVASYRVRRRLQLPVSSVEEVGVPEPVQYWLADYRPCSVIDRGLLSCCHLPIQRGRLNRFEERGFDAALYDKSRPGRPSELSDDQFEQFTAVLHGPPEEAGYDPAWSTALARHYLIKTSDVAFSRHHVCRLMHKAGVSPKTPRPEPVSADEAEHERPDHRWNLELAVAFDHADCLGVVFESRRWKERSEPLFNSARGGFVGHTELLLTPFMYRLRFQS